MLTQVFDATNPPESSRKIPGRRTDVAGCKKKADSVENGKESASGFLAVMLQAADIHDVALQTSSLSSGAGKNGGQTGTAEASTAFAPAKESSETVLQPTETSDLRSDDPSGHPSDHSSGDPSGDPAGHRPDRRIGHGWENTPEIGSDILAEDGGNLGGAAFRPSAGRAGRNIREPASLLPSSRMNDARRNDGPNIVSDMRFDTGSDAGSDAGFSVGSNVRPQIRFDHRWDHGGGDGRPEDHSAIGAPDISSAGSAVTSASPATEGSGGTAPRTWSPAEIPDQVAAHARLAMKGGAPEIEIVLRPESLGHLRIRVSTDHRRVSVRILAEKTTAANVMNDHASQLETTLRAAGFEMAHFEVSVERPTATPADTGAGNLSSIPADDGGELPEADISADSVGAGKLSIPAAAGLSAVDRIDFFV